MSTSYGTITITDTTDLGQLSVYLTGSTVRQQVYDSNGSSVTYYPNWNTTSGTPLVLTPHVYFNGQSQALTSNAIDIQWSKIGSEGSYNLPVTPATTACPETACGTSNKELQRPANLSTNSAGVTYQALVTYYPISGDLNTSLTAVATFDITIANNGIDGAPGNPAKSLQLISDGTAFTYRYNGTLFGDPTIVLTAQKNSMIEGVHWYCDNTLIRVSNGSPVITNDSSLPAYTGLSLEVGGDGNTKGVVNINTLSPNYSSTQVAQFKVVETNSSGVEVVNGFMDYCSIYKLVEAQPGTSAYVSYLDNDEETINEYNGVLNYSNAISTLYVTKGGINDLTAGSGWVITITDSNNITYQSSKGANNATNYNNSVTVQSLTGNSGWIEFTATKTEGSNVITLVQRFTVNRGASVISHSLRLDAVASNRNSNGVYTPSTIQVDAITRSSGGSSSYRDAGVISTVTHYVGNNNTTSATNTANNALTLTLTDHGTYGKISYIEAFLGTGPNYEDKQKIVISSDGVDGDDGTSPWMFRLGNSFDGISTDFAYAASDDFTIIIPISAAQGTTEKVIYYGGQNYPTITADALSKVPSGTISAEYYMNNTKVTTAGNQVNNIRYKITEGDGIGQNGSVTLTLTYGAEQTLTQNYTYNAQPEAIKPIRVFLTPSPTDTFENQEGTITVTPTVLSGTTSISSSSWGSPTWEVFTGSPMQWKTIVQAAIPNVSVTNNVLSVSGSAVEGYLGFRFTTTINRGGVAESYTEYINLKDIDDPLHVTLHSTVGEQIVNHQGLGVIYARVIRRGDTEDLDSVVPDNMLRVGTSNPSQNGMTGVTGYIKVNTTTGETSYYARTSDTSAWGSPRSTFDCTYEWTFRDSNNAPIDLSANNTPAALAYTANHNTQFVYVDSSVINNKLTADVKVTL